MFDDDMEEGAGIQETIGQMMATTKQALKICKATGLKVDMTLMPDEYNDTFSGYFKIGDYEIWVNESLNIFRLDYEPYDDLEKWERDVNPSRIISFTMPPLPEEGESSDE